MAVVTAHTLTCCVAFRSAFHRESLGHLDLAKRAAAIVGTVAVGTSCRARLCRVLMPGNPALADRVQAMGTAGGGHRHSLVASRTFIDGTGMPLNRQTLHIIVYM